MDVRVLRCTFVISFEEFREAVLAVRQENLRRQHAINSRRPLRFLALLGVFGSAVGAALLLSIGFRLDAFPQIRPPIYVLATLVMPGAIVAAAVVGLAHLQRVKLVEPRRSPLRRLSRAVLPVVLFAALLALALIEWWPHAHDRDPTTGGPAYDWFGSLFPHAAWAFYFGIILAVSERTNRQQIEKLWEQQPGLTRERIVELSDDGLTIDERVTSRRYQWPALVRLIETDRLFLTCPSDVAFEVLPKRAFASAAEVDLARSLLRENIRDREAAHAFAVLPATVPRT